MKNTEKSEEDGRSPIFADDVCLWEDDRGWWVDYVPLDNPRVLRARGPFARKEDARNHTTVANQAEVLSLLREREQIEAALGVDRAPA